MSNGLEIDLRNGFECEYVSHTRFLRQTKKSNHDEISTLFGVKKTKILCVLHIFLFICLMLINIVQTFDKFIFSWKKDLHFSLWYLFRFFHVGGVNKWLEVRGREESISVRCTLGCSVCD